MMFGRRKKAAPPPERRAPSMAGGGAETSAPTGHESVRRADPYAFQVAHRRLAWMFRVSAMLNVGLCAVVIVEASAISQLVPLQHLQLGLVRIEPSTDRIAKVDPASLVRIEPITADVDGYDLMLEAFVRRYVRLLLEIDKVSQTDRMQRAAMFSEARFWDQFGKERFKSIEKALDTSLNRSIVVETIDLVSRRGGVSRYAVDLVQTDERKGEMIETKKLRAYLAVTAAPQTIQKSEQYENPAGFRVIDLALKERGNS
jgi:type IV secretion system protein VirB8